MKIDSYEILSNTIIIHFDVSFKNLNYVKMEMEMEDSNEFECEEMKIKYSKNKNTLNLFINEKSNMVVILITEMDNVQFCYSYCIKINKSDDLPLHKSDDLPFNLSTLTDKDLSPFMNVDMNNISKLLFKEKSENNKYSDNKMSEDLFIKIQSIKNQNIFANIKKKLSNGT